METEEKKVYTIEDIARELGVSKTTVSGYLRKGKNQSGYQRKSAGIYKRT